MRSIPAWAGEPVPRYLCASDHLVYPRVGGGTAFNFRNPSSSIGLSPRGRGNQFVVFTVDTIAGSIPAWAGEPRNLFFEDTVLRVYPRVGGGTFVGEGRYGRGSGLSPRGRGNPNDLLEDDIIDGSIPAWAGEPVSVKVAHVKTKVYPRVGGGTA